MEKNQGWEVKFENTASGLMAWATGGGSWKQLLDAIGTAKGYRLRKSRGYLPRSLLETLVEAEAEKERTGRCPHPDWWISGHSDRICWACGERLPPRGYGW